jgi:anti-anti-sigma factor
MSTTERLSVGPTRNGILIRVDGRGTAVASPTFERLVKDALQRDHDSIGVDLTECEYLDSTFLGCLVTMHRKSRDVQGDPFVIVAPAAARRRLFHTARLDKVLRFVDQGEPLVGQTVDVEISSAERDEFGRHVANTHRALASLGGTEADKFEQIADSIERELGASD